MTWDCKEKTDLSILTIPVSSTVPGMYLAFHQCLHNVQNTLNSNSGQMGHWESSKALETSSVGALGTAPAYCHPRNRNPERKREASCRGVKKEAWVPSQRLSGTPVMPSIHFPIKLPRKIEKTHALATSGVYSSTLEFSLFIQTGRKGELTM